MMDIRYLINRKSGISIAVAIPLYPSHRTSRKEAEGGLLCPLTREQFEMQEVAELAVVTLLVRYKTVYKSAYSSPSWKRRGSWKKNPGDREQVSEIQRLEKEGWVKWKIKRKQHRDKYTHRDFQRDGEENDSDTEMQSYTHWGRQGTKRTCWIKCRKVLFHRTTPISV